MLRLSDTFALLLVAMLPGTFAAHGAAAADVRMFRYEATVFDAASVPGTPFEAVRQGDTVRGMLRYDLAAEREGDQSFAVYAFADSFAAASMYVDISATNSSLSLLPDTVAGLTSALVFDEPADGFQDGIALFQDVVSPQGHLGEEPIVLTEFAAPPDLLETATLPDSLNLDDWLYMLMIFESDAGYIEAEIYDLAPIVPGDYDDSQTVTVADYAIWKLQFGEGETLLSADGNSDGYVNLADYTTWRDALGSGLAGNTASRAVAEPGDASLTTAAVPEPASALLGLLAVGSIVVFRRVTSCYSDQSRMDSPRMNTDGHRLSR